jgi:Ca2+-binding EF-hand superfamily protein
MMGRINESLGSKNDRILIETIMEELDGDEDGYIGVEDVERINEELGCVLSKGEIEKMMERICVDGRKIGKKELEGIMWR